MQVPYREREPLQAVACIALYPCIQTSPMWLLAVAHAGSEARVRVLDITDLVARIRISSRGGAAPLRVRTSVLRSSSVRAHFVAYACSNRRSLCLRG